MHELSPSGPPLTSEESERPALAVEVRIRWGADLVRVLHLEPPRSFFIGGAGSDFAVEGEALFGARAPIVLADGSGATAIVPRGTEGIVHEGTPARRRTLEREAGEPGDRRVRLELGTTVTIVLPGGTRGAAYRASPADASTASAPVSFEVALVRAGRVVGRAWSLRGAARPLASFALAASAVLGPLAFTASRPSEAPAGVDPLEVSPEQQYLMQQALQAVDEREMEAREAANQNPFGDEEAVEIRSTRTGSGQWVGRYQGSAYQNAFDEEIHEHPFDDPVAYQMAVRYLCMVPEGDPKEAGLPFPSERSAFCGSQVVTPLGLRSQGAPEVRDALGRDTHDRWLFEYPSALGLLGRHEIPNAVLHVGALGEAAPLSPLQRVRAPVMHAIRRGSREIRACYELGPEETPEEMGDVPLVVSLRERAVARVWSGYGQHPPPPHVERCVVRALDGMAIPLQQRTGTWEFSVGMRRRAGRPSR